MTAILGDFAFLNRIAGSILLKTRVLCLTEMRENFRANTKRKDRGISVFLFSSFSKNNGKKATFLLPTYKLIHFLGGHSFRSEVIPINSISKSSGAYLMNPLIKVSTPPIFSPKGSVG